MCGEQIKEAAHSVKTNITQKMTPLKVIFEIAFYFFRFTISNVINVSNIGFK